jgi:sugar (pentulose or hexulose) kinase
MLFAGIDIGTSYTKAVLLTSEFELLEKVSLPADSSNDVEQWYRHFSEIIEYFRGPWFSSDRLVCSIAAQGGTFALLDDKFSAVGAACLWIQKSSGTVVEELVRYFGQVDYYHQTGCVPNEWVMACKLKEMLADRNGNPQRAKYISTVPDFVHARLGDRFVTDITNAQITGMCNFRKSMWSKNICDWVGVGEEALAVILNKPEIILENVRLGGIRLNVAISSHDQYAAMKAVGLGDNDIMLGTGTAWVINGKSKEPLFGDENFQMLSGRDIGSGYGYIVGLGPIGKEFAELLDTLNVSKDTLNEMEKMFCCNSPQVNKAAMVKQFMDSAVAKVGIAVEKLKNKGIAPKKLIMTGGAAASSYLPAAIAASCQLPVEVVKFKELTAYGAALLAAQAAGADIGTSILSANMPTEFVMPEKL